MGNGKKLKNILDDRNMSVRQLAKACGISPTTLYSIIQRDTEIRYDFALRIANVLDIPIAAICNNLPYDKDTTEPKLMDGILNINEDKSKKAYFSYRTLAIAKQFNYEEFPMLDRLIAEFYVLDDEARKEVFQFIEMKHELHNDPERVKKLKEVKK